AAVDAYDHLAGQCARASDTSTLADDPGGMSSRPRLSSQPLLTLGRVRLTTTPASPRTARKISATSPPSSASPPERAPAASRSRPIAVLDTATYSVRGSPSAMSTT